MAGSALDTVSADEARARLADQLLEPSLPRIPKLRRVWTTAGQEFVTRRKSRRNTS